MKDTLTAEQFREKMSKKHQNGYETLTPEDEIAMNAYCEDYKAFLDMGKTEREFVEGSIAKAEARGFRLFTPGMTVQPGDRLYSVNRKRAITLVVIGKESLDKGCNMSVAHLDAPGLDFKPYPFYEEDNICFMKSHYYGGIRKYQWVTIPLELRGVVALRDGSLVKVSVGDKPGDPMFTIDDLLPHLAAKQDKLPLGEAHSGESLNLLVGSRPFKGDAGSDSIKMAILYYLYETYGIIEEDFISAELSAVPAFKAVDIGFDRSMIGAYGQDDRACSYATLAAVLDLEGTPDRTAVAILIDKEENGSAGVTGMKSATFDMFMSDLCQAQGASIKSCYHHSFCLSSDVTAAYDPNYPDVYEKTNCSKINCGMNVSKYLGGRGKMGSSDATAEMVAYVRRTLEDYGVIWQMSELGRIDVGGGGTVASFMVQRGIDTIDAGVPVLSMHSPFETTAKLDCYMTYKGTKAIFEGSYNVTR